MALWNSIKNLFSKNDNRQMQYARMLDGYSPIFAQFGQNIYASDVVQMCIDVIASEISKLQPKHIRTDTNGMQTTVKGSLNRLFKFSPNPLMTTRDFLEKTIWLLFMNYNAFIYPMYELKYDTRQNLYREYTAFYLLNPTQVTFLQDTAGTLFVEFSFANGDKFTLPYSDVIHLRKKFSVNDVMGGGLNGQPDNAALLKVLTINDTVLQGLEKAIKTSLSVRGILKINTMLDDDKQKAERARFETAIATGKSAILPLDLKGEYMPVNVDPKLIDKDTLEFLQSKVLNYYGVSVPILTGDFTDEQYQAFYEKTLEPIIISLGQAFSKTMFTQRETDVGNEIVFYPQKLLFTNTKNKVVIADILGNRGALTNNELLELFGYPPYEGGHVRNMSLNYIDVIISNEYQLKRAGMKETVNQSNSTSQRSVGRGNADYRSIKITLSDEDGDDGEDLEKVKQVIKSLTKAEKKELGPRYFYDDSQYRAFKMDGDKSVAFIENRLTGKKGHLNVAVHPDYRGKGYAEKMIDKAIKDAPDLGAEKIYWITTPENEASRKLAEKVGFTLKSENEDEARYVYELEN